MRPAAMLSSVGWAATLWVYLLWAAAPAQADDDHETARDLRREGIILPLEALIADLEKDGRV